MDVDLSACGSGENVVWDATTRTLSWHLQDVKSNGAHVVHFHLNVHEDWKDGTNIDLSCTCDEDGDVDSTTVIYVHTGKEVDQPFFVGYEDGKFHLHASITRA